MNQLELDQYLQRIGVHERPHADAEGLALLQRSHLAAVPFENLDITAGRIPLALDEAALFDKVVRRRRGGICYELNLLFAAALRALGFDVALKGGRHPKYGDDMDHLFLLVRIRDAEGESGDAPGFEPWIADVGFAANFDRPLRLDVGSVQDDGRDRYVLEDAPDVGEGHLRLMRVDGLVGDGEPVELFAFGPQEYQPEDCRERCDWFSTAPESRFVQGPLVTMQGAFGRKTLSARHYIVTQGGHRESLDLDSPEDFERYLREEFDLIAE